MIMPTPRPATSKLAVFTSELGAAFINRHMENLPALTQNLSILFAPSNGNPVEARSKNQELARELPWRADHRQLRALAGCQNAVDVLRRERAVPVPH
jgi:hypothetical protein